MVIRVSSSMLVRVDPEDRSTVAWFDRVKRNGRAASEGRPAFRDGVDWE